jgi:DNA-binding PadR family transcriptional regulator
MVHAETAENTPDIVPELTAFQQTILVVLAEESRYGLAVKRELQSYYEEEANHGRLYPNLDELVERDLVEKSELDKRTYEYSLTDEGLEAIFEQLDWMFGKIAAEDERADEIRERLDSTSS